MIERILPAAAFAALALSAAAAASAPAQDQPSAPAAVLTAADAVAPVRLAVGETATLRLETNPSTGYGWQVVETRNLRVDEPFEIVRDPATPDGMVGAPETAVIRITPRAKGPASLRLAYVQPWRDAPAERTLYFVFEAE